MSHQPLPQPDKPPVPVLTSLYFVIATVEILAAAVIVLLMITGRFPNRDGVVLVILAIVSAVLHYGIGQVFAYLAQTAHYSRITCEATIAIANRPIQIVEPKAIGFPQLPGEETYHVKLEGDVQGPFTCAQLDMMHARKMIDADTYIIREGAHAWIKLSDLAAHF